MPVTLSGAVPGGSGAIINSGSSDGWLRNVTLAGNTTIATSNNVVIGSSTDSNDAFNLAGFTLTKSGAGVLKLNGLSMSGAGNIVVNQVPAIWLIRNNGDQRGRVFDRDRDADH